MKSKVKAHWDEYQKIKIQSTLRLVNKFNDIAIVLRSIVRLQVLEGRGESFQIILQVRDPFLQNEVYASGNAFVHFNEATHKTIEDHASTFGYAVGWNNTGSIGWLMQKEA